MLRDPDRTVRTRAVDSLREIGPRKRRRPCASFTGASDSGLPRRAIKAALRALSTQAAEPSAWTPRRRAQRPACDIGTATGANRRGQTRGRPRIAATRLVRPGGAFTGTLSGESCFRERARTFSESFRKAWNGWIHSSDGFAVRVRSRTGIDYRDEHGEIRIDSEGMSDPRVEIVVYTGSIPDTPEHPKAEVLDRLRRALEFAGWRMTLEHGRLE